MDRGAEKVRDERNIAMLPRNVLLCVGIYIEGEREVINHFQIMHPSYRSPESPVGRQIIVIKWLTCILASLLVLEWSNL